MKCQHCKDPILKFQKRIVISGDKETAFHEGCYEIVIDKLRENKVKSSNSLKPIQRIIYEIECWLDRRKGCTPVSFSDWLAERKKQSHQLTNQCSQSDSARCVCSFCGDVHPYKGKETGCAKSGD